VTEIIDDFKDFAASSSASKFEREKEGRSLTIKKYAEIASETSRILKFRETVTFKRLCDAHVIPWKPKILSIKIE
jgi:hypothetical protein